MIVSPLQLPKYFCYNNGPKNQGMMGGMTLVDLG